MNAFVVAELNWGRWIVRCPFCNGAELYEGAWPPPGQPVKSKNEFYCHSCGMKENNGKTLPVELPDEVKTAVEMITGKRSMSNRNWKYGESLEHLHAENLQHGIMEG